MKVYYQATVSSNCKEIDGLPMEIPVGSKVACKIRDVDPLCEYCEVGSKEEKWYNEQIVPNIVNG